MLQMLSVVKKMDKIRFGKISDIDYKNGLARIVYDDKNKSVSRKIPFLCSEYNLPKVGQLVCVISDKIILGRFWNKKNLPDNDCDNKIYKKSFSENSFIKYDEQTEKLFICAPDINLIDKNQNINLGKLMQKIFDLQTRIEKLEAKI